MILHVIRVKEEQFADCIQENRTTIAKWETGSAFPRAEKLPLIANALGCTIDELYGREENESSE
ncbi:MAG: helix-turn-helix transcriptional regulator [Butyricicoccus pullicaecorum]|nr:helix-turn-helix transcriptional regulator [Butyricicoccus pullicaecorum]